MDQAGDLRIPAASPAAKLGHGSALAPLWALLAASLLAPVVLFGLASWLNYRSALVSAGQELQRVAEVAREHAASVFDAQSQLVDRINDLVRGMDVAAVAADQQALHEAFGAMTARLPQAQSALLADDTGRALVSGLTYPLLAGANVADRDYFKAVVNGHSAGPYISALQVSDINHLLFFGLARPWLDAAGKPRGVVDVAVSPPFFTDFYKLLVDEAPESAEGSTVLLVRADGDILARFPAPLEQRIGARSAKFVAAIRSNPRDGQYEGPLMASTDRAVNLFAYRKVQGYPVYVVAGRRREAIVAGWRATMASHLIFGVPATLALVAISATALARARRERRALALAQSEIKRRERAEAALLRAQRLEAVGQMTGGVAHDFNNLLTVILGSAELLMRRAEDPGRVRRLAEQIVLATRRGGKITQQLLTFSRRQFLSPEVVDLNMQLQDFQPMLERAAGEAMTVLLDLEAGPHLARLDAGHFEAALLNLVGNARDATEGSGRILITTRHMTATVERAGDLPPGRYVQVSVADTGAGMDRETAAKAFEPFFTTKGIGKGTGLGLSQVYGFAKQAGGDARIVTATGQGTRVELLLPRAELPGKPALPRPAPQPRQTPAGELVILVVEDDAAVLQACVSSLRELGYATLTAGSAQAALDLLASGIRVDLVLSDVAMPGQLNGLQLAERLRRQWPGLKVLLSSGYSGEAEPQPPPGVPLLAKPYDRGQLAAKLLDALSG